MIIKIYQPYLPALRRDMVVKKGRRGKNEGSRKRSEIRKKERRNEEGKEKIKRLTKVKIKGKSKKNGSVDEETNDATQQRKLRRVIITRVAKRYGT